MSRNGTTEFGLDFVTANRFYVEIESSLTAAFTECQGLGVQIQHESISEGGVNDQQRILLGQPKFSEVTLKRGITNDLVFWDWINAVLEQRNQGTAIQQHRRNINILVFNQAGETMQCWTLIGAVPTGWKAPALSADSNSVAIEELTLVYEGLKIIANQGGGGATILNSRDQSGYFASN